MVNEYCERCKKITSTVHISRGMLFYRACAVCDTPRKRQFTEEEACDFEKQDVRLKQWEQEKMHKKSERTIA